MRKLLRKAALAAISISMMFTSISASAEGKADISSEIINFNEDNELTKMYDYISQTLPNHLATFNADTSGITVSNLFSLNAIDSANDGIYVCFVMRDNSVIGELTITSVNNEYYSSFSMTSYPDVTEALHSETAVAFVADGECFYMVDSCNSINTLSSVNSASTRSLSYNQIEADSYELKNIEPVITLTNTATTRATSYLHKVKYSLNLVANSTTYDSDGQCWAACVASKAMYEVVQYMNADLDCDTVYAATKEKYGSVGTGKTRYQRGLATYKITANSNKDNQVFSFADLHSKSQNANMVIMRMKDEDKDASHAVLLAGYYIPTDITGSKYYVMDPNRKTFVSFDINQNQYNTGNNVVYTTNYGYVFTWFDSMYSA